jgi:ABC-type glycerol-3-phosphate transport system substrate-binding protein
MKPTLILSALVALALALAGCGSQSHPAASAPAGHATSSQAQAPSTAASTPSQSGAPAGNAITKINNAFKRLTPQQLAAIKAKLPAYMHALEQCAKATGGAQAATLACLRSHGFGPAAP